MKQITVISSKKSLNDGVPFFIIKYFSCAAHDYTHIIKEAKISKCLKIELRTNVLTFLINQFPSRRDINYDIKTNTTMIVFFFFNN